MKVAKLLLTVALVPVLIGAPPATAGERSHRDPAHDVIAVPPSVGSLPAHPVLAPKMARADIVKIRVVNGARRVRVILTMRNLAKVGGTTYFYAALRTRRGEWQVVFQTEPGTWGGSKPLFRDRDGNPRACARVRHSVNYRANTAALSVPRRCLKRPRFVRVYSDVSLFERGWSYSDRAYSTGLDQGIVFGPKVYR